MLRFYSKPSKKRPEASLQKTVVAHLLLNGAPGMMFHSIPNEAKRSPALGAEMKRMGMKPGAADLFLLIRGKACYLELKRKGEKPRKEQIDFGLEAVDCGGDWAFADSIDDALAILTRWGAIGRAKAA